MVMDTKITQLNPVEYELEITAPAEDLAPEFNKALKEQQSRTTMKGFRPGKVPLGLVKKMYGKAIAYTLADQRVQEAYTSAVLEAGEHDVLGQPIITALDYEPDGDLRAVIKFGVRPDVELQDLSGESISRLVHEVTDEEIDKEIDQLRRDRADLMPIEEEPAAENDLVVFDLQEIDPATQTPIIGKRDENQSLFLDDERIEENALLKALREALVGKRVGETVRFQFEHDKEHAGHAGAHAHHFMADIKEVKRRDLPDLDDEFVEEVTNGDFDTVDAFRGEIRRQLEGMWTRRSRELLEGRIVERMLALHDVQVPESVVNVYLDSFIEDVKQRNEGEWPDSISEADFRASNREEAERQARWMLLRDRIIEEESLEVADADYDAFFEEEAGTDGRITAAQMKGFYRQMPRLMNQLEQRLLSRKVYDVLIDRFDVVDKDMDAMEKEMEGEKAGE